MIDPDIDTARTDAAKRHNFALLGHAGRPKSFGDGLVISCGCGQAFNFDAWRSHIITICIETPVPMRRTE